MEILKIDYPHQFTVTDCPPSSVALGNFDGVHVGHQQVIHSALQIAKESGLRAGLMTFYPHPKEVLGKIEQPSYLTPVEDKLKLFTELGLDFVMLVSFTPEFAQLSPEQFIKEYIVKLNIKHVVTGFDFRFGHQGQGTTADLQGWSNKHQDFIYNVIDSVDDKEVKISSSRVRALLQEGHVEQVYTLLQRYYTLTGRVVHGEKRGRTIGFPTANIVPLYPYVIPRQGVYAVRVQALGQCWSGVCNVGRKPTFHDQNDVSIEVHILDFEAELYEQKLQIEFVSYLRPEQKFDSLEQLVDQITSDVQTAKLALS